MNNNRLKALSESDDGRKLLEQERLIIEVTEAIARLLEEQQVTRSVLAKKIGRSSAFITKLLRGDNNFTLRTLSDVLFALDRSAHFWLGNVGDSVHMCSSRASKPLELDSSSWIKPHVEWKSPAHGLRLVSNNAPGVAA